MKNSYMIMNIIEPRLSKPTFSVCSKHCMHAYHIKLVTPLKRQIMVVSTKILMLSACKMD